MLKTVFAPYSRHLSHVNVNPTYYATAFPENRKINSLFPEWGTACLSCCKCEFTRLISDPCHKLLNLRDFLFLRKCMRIEAEHVVFLGMEMIKEYREAYNMFCCSGILFNHESERRGETFVTRKITLAAARIAQGKQDKLLLGNLDSLRDWGYAKDYVECMWLILQNEKPEDYVIATGVQHSVREFATLAFHYAGIELEWKGSGLDEVGIDKATGKVLVAVSPDFYRPTDVVNLWGDPTKAKTELGWNPTKTSFEELVKIMTKHDMEKVAVERAEEHIRQNLAEYLE